MKNQFRVIANVAALIAAGLATAGRADAQGRYVVTDLGVLPGTTLSVATGLNDRGDIVGYCSGAARNSQIACAWHNGAIRSLGKFSGGIYSYANAVNGRGVVVGDGDTGNYRPQSWVAGPSRLINIFPNNGGNTHAIAINDLGVICGNYTKSLSGNVSSWKPALWTVDPKDPRKYRTTVLPILVGPNPTFAGTGATTTAFNQSGQAAGYAQNEVMGQHACFWNNDAAHSIVDLGVFPGDWSSLGWSMNDLGQVAGESHPPFGSRPVIWNSDPAHTPFELPLLAGDNYGSANAVNNLGQAIGSSAYGVPGTWNIGPARLVVWRDGGVFDLQASLDPTTGAGWSLLTATAINNSGQIVGLGVHNGLNRAYLLTPVGP